GLDGGALGRAIVPSGASTGEHEALELRDGDAKRYLGKGVLKAVEHVRDVIAPTLLGMDASDQVAVDGALLQLDGTPLKTLLGGRGRATNVGDEGGFAPSLESAEEALAIVLEAIGKAGYDPGKQIFLALDCAASAFFDKKAGTYDYEGKPRTAAEMIEL